MSSLYTPELEEKVRNAIANAYGDYPGIVLTGLGLKVGNNGSSFLDLMVSLQSHTFLFLSSSSVLISVLHSIMELRIPRLSNSERNTELFSRNLSRLILI